MHTPWETKSDGGKLTDVYFICLPQFYALAILSPDLDYSRLLKQFCALSIEKSSSQQRIIGLHALDGVISSDLFYGSDFKVLASPVIPSILHNLEGVDPKALER
jgi:hypothetical protein